MKLSKDTFISTDLFKWCWRFVYDHYIVICLLLCMMAVW